MQLALAVEQACASLDKAQTHLAKIARLLRDQTTTPEALLAAEALRASADLITLKAKLRQGLQAIGENGCGKASS